MILSPFTPLFFPSAKADGIESAYIQTFAPADKILIELLFLAMQRNMFAYFLIN